MTQRDHAFDNLRTFLVLCIVLLHAACAYATIIPWWHARDDLHPAFDLLILVIDGFALPVLFFVAGAYAQPSLAHRGTARFIGAKLRRLGIPLLLLVPLYLPTMVYLGYLRRTADPLPFTRYWLRWMRSLTNWDFAVITDIQTGAKYQDAASPHHLWFLSLLLLFFLGYAAWRRLIRPRSAPRSLSLLIPASLVAMAAGIAAVNLLVPDWAWARLGPFLLVQPTRLPLYAGMFVFGALARPHLAEKRPFPVPDWVWAIVFVLALTAELTLMKSAIAIPGPASPVLATLNGLFRAVMAVAATALGANLFRRFLSGPARWRESVSAASYDIYIWHMPLVVYAQAALFAAFLPAGLKMAVAFAFAVAASWAIGKVSARFV